MAKDSISAECVRELLKYDSSTGVFTWIVNMNNRVRVGNFAGSLDSKGYWRVHIHGRDYKAHRLAWLYVYGVWPDGQIDHINGQRDDNRVLNLRDATHAENQQNQRKPRPNNKSGFLGVHWRVREKKWKAQIKVGGKIRFLGHFNTPELAHAAYLSAKRELHPACTI